MKLAIYDTQRIVAPVADEQDPRLCAECPHQFYERGATLDLCRLFGARLTLKADTDPWRFARAEACISATGWTLTSLMNIFGSHQGASLRRGAYEAELRMGPTGSCHPPFYELTMSARRGSAMAGHWKCASAHRGGDDLASYATRIVELLLLGLDPEDAWQRVAGKDGEPC